MNNPNSNHTVGLAEKLIQEIREQARADFAADILASIEPAERVIAEIRALAMREATKEPPLPKRSAKVTKAKTAAQAAREKDLEIVYSVITNAWQETRAIFEHAKRLGLRTGATNCHKKLRELLGEGFIELDKNCARQRWRLAG